MKGSDFRQITPNITLGCISPEAADLLDVIMAEWEKHLAELKQTFGEGYEPEHYGFAYWLVRWSGLIEPSMSAKKKAAPAPTVEAK